jgi:hypothetical protein
MINLFTTYYHDEKRFAELNTVLQKNENNIFIDKIYLLDETGTLSSAKQIQNRPTFKEIFDYVNEVTNDNDINIIANSDIYFDEEGLEIIKLLLEKDDCWALTRWDALTGQFMGRRDSQDSWLFRGKIKTGNYDFLLGFPGCDNRLAYELQQAGYNLSNPSRTIKTYHLHNGDDRSWHGKPQIRPPYLLLEPHQL